MKRNLGLKIKTEIARKKNCGFGQFKKETYIAQLMFVFFFIKVVHRRSPYRLLLYFFS